MSNLALKGFAEFYSIFLGRAWRDTRGSTAVEYGLIAAGIALAIIASVMIVGDSLSNIFGVVGSTLSSASDS